MSNKILYSAVVLNEPSANILSKRFGKKMPSGWTWFGHHMTINLGELEEKLKDRVGEDVVLTVTDLGISGLTMAVKVSPQGIKSKNKTPHITLAVNKSGGGKPKDSNDIVNWDEGDFSPFPISGTITEVGR